MAINSSPFVRFLVIQSSYEVNAETLHFPPRNISFKDYFTYLREKNPTCAPELSAIIRLIDKASTDFQLQEQQAKATELLKSNLEEEGGILKQHFKWLQFLFELINRRLLNQYTSRIEVKVTNSAQYFVLSIEIEQITLCGCDLDHLRDTITHRMLARLGLENNYVDYVTTLNEANQNKIDTLVDELFHQLNASDPDYFHIALAFD
ncbi:MAG: hypothetical protein HAW66_09270 [Shewanella sp.]|nr:hypothetical protein [Shewanella sp.]